MIGWISIHRKIKEHWVWEEKPFSKGQAWIDLLMMANHEDKKVLLGSELIEVKRGSRITSEVKLADRWGWSRTKVRSFLALLEEDKMIKKTSDNKKTTLTIVNYNDYQIIKTAEEHQKNIKKTSEKHQKNTNNNENNENNDNNKNISLQISNLRARYPDKDLQTIDNYFDILRWTRKHGKIADSVILKIYTEWEKYSIEKVIYSLEVYINNPRHHDKKENYCYGIMRNTTMEEVEGKKESIEQDPYSGMEVY